MDHPVPEDPQEDVDSANAAVFRVSDIEPAIDLMQQKNDLDAIHNAQLRYHIRWGFPAPRTRMERLKAAWREWRRP